MSLLENTTVVENTPLNKPMNPEVKEIWLAALRGKTDKKYHQGKSLLRKVFKRPRKNGEVEGYCCLGVLCDLYQEKTGKGQWVLFNTTTNKPDAENGDEWRFMVMRNRFDNGSEYPDYSSGLPPCEVLQWAGINIDVVTPYVQVNLDNKDAVRFDPNGDKRYPMRRQSLTHLNDTGRTFKTIANVIEKYL